MPWQWPLFPCFGPSRPITKSYTIQHLPYLWYGQVFFHVQVHWDFSSSYEHFKGNFSSTSIRRIGLRSVPSPTWMLKFFFWLHLCSQITFIGLDGLLLWSLYLLSLFTSLEIWLSTQYWTRTNVLWPKPSRHHCPFQHKQ